MRPAIFVTGFLIRFILIIAVNRQLWVSFTRDYPDEMTISRMLPAQFVIYNIIPYSTLVYLHWRSFRPKTDVELDERQPRDQSVEPLRDSPSNFSSVITQNNVVEDLQVTADFDSLHTTDKTRRTSRVLQLLERSCSRKSLSHNTASVHYDR